MVSKYIRDIQRRNINVSRVKIFREVIIINPDSDDRKDSKVLVMERNPFTDMVVDRYTVTYMVLYINSVTDIFPDRDTVSDIFVF